MAIIIGDKSFEVDATVEAYVNTLTKGLQDSKKELETQKESIMKEIEEQKKIEDMKKIISNNNISLKDEEININYMQGVIAGLKVSDSNFVDIKDHNTNLNFDDIIIEGV